MWLLVDNRLCLHIIKRVCVNNDYNGIEDLNKNRENLIGGTRTMAQCAFWFWWFSCTHTLLLELECGPRFQVVTLRVDFNSFYGSFLTMPTTEMLWNPFRTNLSKRVCFSFHRVTLPRFDFSTDVNRGDFCIEAIPLLLQTTRLHSFSQRGLLGVWTYSLNIDYMAGRFLRWVLKTLNNES